MRFPTSPLHLCMLAAAAAVAGGGLVGGGDVLFVVLSFPYIYLLSAAVFPARGSGPEPPVLGGGRRALGLYVAAGAVVGLALPAGYVVWGGPGRAGAAAHLFLLASQVVAEGATFSGGCSLPIRALVPIWFNSRRLFAIADWLRAELGAAGGRRLGVGGGLALVNLAFWSFNLFAFLLPVFLPRALRAHFSRP
ncbi:uncharacterized protein LOC144700034 [Wolffia australiana]